MRILVHSSLDLRDLMIEARSVLEGLGCSLILPDLTRYQHIRDELGRHDEFNDIKHRLARQNAENVAKCDGLVVINPRHRGIDNYIGGNSFFEMSIAFFLHKPIFLTNPIPTGLPFTEEVESFFPVVIGPVRELSSQRWRVYARAAGLR